MCVTHIDHCKVYENIATAACKECDTDYSLSMDTKYCVNTLPNCEKYEN